MSNNGNGNGHDPADIFERATDAVEDAVSYPILTTEAGGSRLGGSGGGSSAGSIGATAERAIREAIGWRYRRGDAKGFVSALTKAFDLKDKNGHTETVWKPQNYSVAADLGELTGALASLHQQATAIVEDAIPLLDALESLSLISSKEDQESIRGIIRDELLELPVELGRANGPRAARMNNFFDLLLGPNPVSDPETMEGQIGILRKRFGLRQIDANSVHNERNLTNFLILADRTYWLWRMWTDKAQEIGGVGGQFLGVQLVTLSQLLAVISESVQEAYSAMDSVFLSSSERDVFQLELQDGTTMTIGELLGWLETVATKDGPRLLQGGKDGVEFFYQTITRLKNLVAEAVEISAGEDDGVAGVGNFGSRRVNRALRELAKHVAEASAQSFKVRRVNVTYAEQHSVSAAQVGGNSLLGAPQIASLDVVKLAPGTKAKIVNIFGRNLKRGGRIVVDGDGVTTGKLAFIDDTHLAATFDVAANAFPGARSVFYSNHGAKAVLPFSLEIAAANVAQHSIDHVEKNVGVQGPVPFIGTIVGSGFTSLPEVEFGDDIGVMSAELDPAYPSHRILVELDLSAANTGPHRVTATIGDETVELCNAFTVEAGKKDRPREGGNAGEPPEPKVEIIDPVTLTIGVDGQKLTLKGHNLAQVKHVVFEGLHRADLQPGATDEAVTFAVAVKNKLTPGQRKLTVQDAQGHSFATGQVLMLNY